MYFKNHFYLFLIVATVVTLDLETRSMENLRLPVFDSILAVSSVVFISCNSGCSKLGYGDSEQQKEKSVILLLFWVPRPAALFAFFRRETKFREKTVVS
jgi:hypothetical protein